MICPRSNIIILLVLFRFGFVECFEIEKQTKESIYYISLFWCIILCTVLNINFSSYSYLKLIFQRKKIIRTKSMKSEHLVNVFFYSRLRLRQTYIHIRSMPSTVCFLYFFAVLVRRSSHQNTTDSLCLDDYVVFAPPAHTMKIIHFDFRSSLPQKLKENLNSRQAFNKWCT